MINLAYIWLEFLTHFEIVNIICPSHSMYQMTPKKRRLVCEVLDYLLDGDN